MTGAIEVSCITCDALRGEPCMNLSTNLDVSWYHPARTAEAKTVDDDGVWVVWNADTGYSDESMRFATKAEAEAYVNEEADDEFGTSFGMRYEP